MFFTKCLILCVFITGFNCDEIPTVETSNGVVSGTIQESYGGRPFASFEGIPFAKPPVDDLRFEPPQKIGNWTGTWAANTKHTCLQSFVLRDVTKIEGNEDCLYLNVYVPKKDPNSSDNFDVIVHIHGGAFMVGNSHSHSGPKFLMDEDVIYVSMNYRLGPFGFLSTEDEALPGNNGLKDQSFALKWIQENIRHFGGNSDSVTLTGLSAGGASVHFHYLSPLSKGYFHRGISQSGTALNPWSIQKTPLEKAKKMADLMGCDLENTMKIVKCLRQRPAYKIAEAIKDFYDYDGFPFSPFGPVVEFDIIGSFLPYYPYRLLADGKINDVPLIFSVTVDEGIAPGALSYKDLSKVEEDWEKLLPHLLDYSLLKSHVKDISKKIKQFYFENEPISIENFHLFIKMLSDRHFLIGSETSARMQSKVAKSPTYHYMFGYRGQHSFSEFLLRENINIGVSHGDDILYYLDTPIMEKKLSEDDEEMKSFFLKMVTSFAKNGIPDVGTEWKPITDEKTFNTLYIKSPKDVKMKRVEELTPVKFWTSLGLTEHIEIVSVKDEL